MAADEGSRGTPNPQGPESGEMYRWQGSTSARVQENTRRLNAINGQIENIERCQESIRSDVRSISEKLDAVVAGQAATLANVSSIDWKTIGTIVTLVVGPLVAAYLGTGGGP